MSGCPSQQDFINAAKNAYAKFNAEFPNSENDIQSFISGFCSGSEFTASASQQILINAVANYHIARIIEENK